MRAYGVARHPLSVQHQLFPLNDFLSKTTRPISAKLEGNIIRGWEFRFVQILGPKRGQNKDNFDKSSKIFFSLTTGWNELIFDLKHPWGKEIQFCSNEVLGITNSPRQGLIVLHSDI